MSAASSGPSELPALPPTWKIGLREAVAPAGGEMREPRRFRMKDRRAEPDKPDRHQHEREAVG